MKCSTLMTQQVSIHYSPLTLASYSSLICRSLMQARRFKHLYGSYGKALLEESASNKHFTMVQLGAHIKIFIMLTMTIHDP